MSSNMKRKYRMHNKVMWEKKEQVRREALRKFFETSGNRTQVPVRSHGESELSEYAHSLPPLDLDNPAINELLDTSDRKSH